MEDLAPAPTLLSVEGQPAQSAEPTPEQTAVVADLHWLIHQGHVIEFANGTLETAKKPIPRPPKPEAKLAQPEGEAPAQPEAPSESAPAEPALPIASELPAEQNSTADVALPAPPSIEPASTSPAEPSPRTEEHAPEPAVPVASPSSDHPI
jgi:hypothetical protein